MKTPGAPATPYARSARFKGECSPPHASAASGGEGSGVGVLKGTQSQRKRDARVPRARAMRHEPTDAERVLWQRLRRLPVEGSHFRRQATIGFYFADFACHRSRLVIEIDGGQHNEARGIARDAARTADLESRGYRVLRFWNNDVLGNVEGVMEVIHAAVRQAGPPPPTPPRHASRGGRGDESSALARRRPRRDSGGSCS
jgi:very-short-patch-repair endonuclease